METEKTTSIKISTHSPFQKLKAVAIGQGLSEDIFDFCFNFIKLFSIGFST